MLQESLQVYKEDFVYNYIISRLINKAIELILRYLTNCCENDSVFGRCNYSAHIIFERPALKESSEITIV